VADLIAPRPTPISLIRELVADGAELATAMLDVASQLSKRIQHIDGSPAGAISAPNARR